VLLSPYSRLLFVAINLTYLFGIFSFVGCAWSAPRPCFVLV
jgi:hypothetical protein